MKNKECNFIEILSKFFLSADLRLLKLCPDELVKFIRNEVLIILITGLAIYVVPTTYSYYFGVFVFFTYKWFLSSLDLSIKENTSAGLKYVIASTIAIILTLSFCVSNRIYADKFYIILVVLYVLLFVCIAPIRTNSMRNSAYAKLVEIEIKNRNSLAEEYLLKENELKLQAQQIYLEIQEKEHQKYVTTISKDILNSRIHIAKVALEKWEKHQLDKVDKNLSSFIKF